MVIDTGTNKIYKSYNESVLTDWMLWERKDGKKQKEISQPNYCNVYGQCFSYFFFLSTKYI